MRTNHDCTSLWYMPPETDREKKPFNFGASTGGILQEYGYRVAEFLLHSRKTEVEVEFVKVKKSALERLITEVMQLHDILPKILNSDILESLQKLDAFETIVEKKANELEQLRMDCEHYKVRLEAAQADCVRERKEKLNIQQQLSDAKQQLLQQAEYCTEMGAAVCTLLWSVSNNEEAVKNILGSLELTLVKREIFAKDIWSPHY
ncbi:PREDICTED: heat shock factor 2-binding protein-like, partial [Thamnophis sirtalis]|uniref:Heat shock factor 2-binding protein-like n=1 Tax=Thamnophis sirtalis TaxID=35019 RepID=A0A6I9YRD8_9SAUR